MIARLAPLDVDQGGDRATLVGHVIAAIRGAGAGAFVERQLNRAGPWKERHTRVPRHRIPHQRIVLVEDPDARRCRRSAVSPTVDLVVGAHAFSRCQLV